MRSTLRLEAGLINKGDARPWQYTVWTAVGLRLQLEQLIRYGLILQCPAKEEDGGGANPSTHSPLLGATCLTIRFWPIWPTTHRVLCIRVCAEPALFLCVLCLFSVVVVVVVVVVYDVVVDIHYTPRTLDLAVYVYSARQTCVFPRASLWKRHILVSWFPDTALI